jgi:neutral amino acid transport system substrate-binding protein
MQEPVVVGVVMPLTGELGTDGPGWVNGMRLAEREVNAAGGVLGRTVRLEVSDSETNGGVAVRRAMELVTRAQSRAVGILGGAASAESLPIYERVTSPMRIPQISCCSTSPQLTEVVAMQAPGDRFFFRTAPPDDLQAVVVVDIARQEGMCTRLAVLHLNDPYGEPFGEAIERLWREGGGMVAVRVPYEDGRPNYDAEVRMVAMANPDCVALVAFPASAGIIFRAWNALPSGMRPAMVKWIGTDGIKSDGFIMEVGNRMLADGVLGSVPVTDPMADPGYIAFRNAYMAAFGTPPTPFTANSYDAAALMMLAIEAAGSTDGDAIRDAIRRVTDPSARTYVRAGNLADALRRIRAGEPINYEGASGPVDVDEFGNVVTDYEVWRYDAAMDRFETVRTISANEIRR